ncbi:MAG: MBL fold metallo-hydrolase [Kiritimatiellales bacterium]|nr:MBL fold metallo-hydrolase [Kiritimatiellales bacterium]
MSLQVCVLASGSSGNATYVASGKTRILIDAGLSAKQMAIRLGEIGVEPESIDGIWVSHEHTDHIAGIRLMQQRYGIPVFANQGTYEAIQSSINAAHAKKNSRGNTAPHTVQSSPFVTGSSIIFGDLTIHPFEIAHDAIDPVGFRIESNTCALGIVTDMGKATALVRHRLSGCHAIIVEANHDEDLLFDAPRPAFLKQRVRSSAGHLSNIDAARLISECAADTLEHVFLAHLSSDCNTPDTALRTVASQLRLDGLGHIKIELTYLDRISAVWQRT